MRDQNATKRTSGQTAAGIAFSAAIDTRAPKGVGDLAGRAKLFIAIPAIPGLSAASTVALSLEDSDDGSTWAAVAAYPITTVTGVGGTGSPAALAQLEWSSKLRRYIRVKEVLTGSNATAWQYDFGVELGSAPGV